MADSVDTASSSLRSHMRACISELNARILALEKSLAVARCERENLQSQLDDHTFPIFTLPGEITSEIFINFLPIYPLCPPPTGLLSPTMLGQICHNWRDIALGTPQLWRAVEIQVDLGIRHLFSAQLNLLNTWLSRSQHCPLSLSVRSLGHSYEDGPSDLRRLTDTIFRHSDHLEYMKLLIPFRDLYLDGIQGPFPLLRDLAFGPSDAYELSQRLLSATPLL